MHSEHEYRNFPSDDAGRLAARRGASCGSRAGRFLLFAQIEYVLFGRPVYGDIDKVVGERPAGKNALLAFSAGEDSTAAATLLPDDVVKYHCARSYSRYRRGDGQWIQLAPTDAIERACRAVPNTLMIPNDFECIGIAVGTPHGYRHNFGYAALGVLLADHFDAGTLAFGSVMEQVFMGSGNNYIDIAAMLESRANRLKELFRKGGTFFALPTGGLSEVITNRIAREGRYGGLAVPCPSADAEGKPCGVCFKCFRKTRLDGAVGRDPNPGVLKIIEKYPLKSATSLVYAAQKSGYSHPAIDPYKGQDLSFLERYHDHAVEHFMPDSLRESLRHALVEHGVVPMTEGDEQKLRGIGRVFWPEQFNAEKAGLR